MAFSTQLLHQLLDHWPIGRFATVDAEGCPHIVPIVFCREGELIFSPVDGKRKSSPDLRRFRNLEAHADSSLLLDHYDQDWDRLWWVRIDCTARRVEVDSDLSRQLEDRLRLKYPQYGRVPLQYDGDIYLEIRIGKVVAWSQTGTLAPFARFGETPTEPSD